MLVVSPNWPELEGEKLLLASIIRRAAYDIAEYRGSTRLEHKKIWRDAYDWMFRPPGKYEDPDDELMSFSNICEVLRTDPRYIRSVTKLMSKRDIKRYQMVERSPEPVLTEAIEELEEVCERLQQR